MIMEVSSDNCGASSSAIGMVSEPQSQVEEEGEVLGPQHRDG